MAKQKNPLQTASEVIEFLKTQTNEVVLFFSGGKDSLILLDMLHKSGIKCHLAFMYLVDNLEHTEMYLKWAAAKYGVDYKKYPHFMLPTYLNGSFFRFHGNTEVPNIKLADIEAQAKLDFNCEWIVYGMKKSDALNRRLMLKTYFMEAICFPTKKVYPLTDWKKGHCLQYIKQHKLPQPIEYGEDNSRSAGVGINAATLKFCKKYYPNDYKKILEVFPFLEVLLVQPVEQNEHKQVSEIRGGNNQQEVD